MSILRKATVLIELMRDLHMAPQCLRAKALLKTTPVFFFFFISENLFEKKILEIFEKEVNDLHIFWLKNFSLKRDLMSLLP